MGSEDRLLYLWLATLTAALVVFGLSPHIDLAVSGFFYGPGTGFPLLQSAWIEAARLVLWTISEVFCLLALIGFVLALATGRDALRLPARVWGFVLALYVLGPGIIVNGLLKRYWGRARPDAIAEFGGDKVFSAPLIPSDQCAANCSFVSGEAAAATAIGITLFVILWHFRHGLTPAAWRVGRAIAIAVPVTGAAVRVIVGRHFLSDVIFAILIVSGIALALNRLILRGRGGSRQP